MKYQLEIQKILYLVDDNKSMSPKDKIKMLSQAVAIADENEDLERGYDTRLRLIEECYYIPSSTILMKEFTWILNAYENNPDLFDENDFLSRYKWILVDVYNNTKVPMEQINHIMEDFKSRLIRNGYGLRPYYDRLLDEAVALGEFDKAKEYYDLLFAEPDDAISNCPACTLDGEIDFFISSGNFEEGYKRTQPLLTGQLKCTHVPARTFCNLVYHALKTNRKELAAELYEKAVTVMQKLFNDNDESMCISAARLCFYLFQTGNNEKGWEYFQKSFPWFLETNDYAKFMYTSTILEGMKGKEFVEDIEIELPEEFELYNPTQTYKVIDLQTYLRKEAQQLAKAFDERNSRTVYQERIKDL